MKNDSIIYLDCVTKEYVGDSIDKKMDDYSLEECVLIRATDIFPFDKIIETPANARAYSFGKSSIIGDYITKKVKKDIAFDPFNDEEYDKLDKELKKYEVAFETFRSTIHFTINGLVSSHMYGNFDKRDYIIIDLLKYHIDNKSLLALRPEDTYFNDNLVLSDESAIIIKEDKFNKIKNDPLYINTLSKFKIFIYKGENLQLAVKKTLTQLGYDSFIVNNHGYLNGLDNNTGANKMWEFLKTIRNTYNISANIHFNSVYNYQDRELREKEAEKTDLRHFLYIINNAQTISLELKNKIIELINKDKESLKELIPEIIEIITLEEIERLTKEFNQIFINELKEGKRPKNK